MIDGKPVLCINKSAYVHQSNSDFSMVSLQDVIKDFFPNGSLPSFIDVFQNVLNVAVYKANWHQMHKLMEAWNSAVAPDVVPLIQVADLQTYLTQLKYIQRQTLQPQPKRIRTT